MTLPASRYLQIEAPWREPAEVLATLADQPWAIGFISGGERARWSYVAVRPEAILVAQPHDPADPFAALAHLAGEPCQPDPDGPPFQGGVAGLLAYELGDRIEDLGLPRLAGWPDLACARYDALLAFDHQGRRTLALGRGLAAEANASRALGWLERRAPPPRGADARLTSEEARVYEAAVAEVVSRIGAGELFQANIARRWCGRLPAEARPVDVLRRLAAASPAPFATYLRLPDRALVSNSPERFVRVRREDGVLHARTEPIKGTSRRGATAEADRASALALAASEKDRAENLMIVDLMRNDLARVCEPGQVKTPELFQIASFANVHHLVSAVTGRLSPHQDAVALLRATFPPGSITGAPKVQAMKVIAQLEAPRGPFFGSMFLLGADGGLDSNVLIRTATFVADADGWAVEARAGAGIVADSDPVLERRETEAKVSALAAALGR